MIDDVLLPPLYKKLLILRCNHLTQQAAGLKSQRDAVLSELGEIKRMLNITDTKTLEYHESDHITYAKP